MHQRARCSEMRTSPESRRIIPSAPAAVPRLWREEIDQRVDQLRSQPRLVIAHGFLHQHAVNQLTEPCFGGMDGEDVVFGGGPWRWADPECAGRDVAE